MDHRGYALLFMRIHKSSHPIKVGGTSLSVHEQVEFFSGERTWGLFWMAMTGVAGREGGSCQGDMIRRPGGSADHPEVAVVQPRGSVLAFLTHFNKHKKCCLEMNFHCWNFGELQMRKEIWLGNILWKEEGQLRSVRALKSLRSC